MRIYLVGGAVRDMVLHNKPHDFDYVVFGATIAEMKQAGFQQVGREFPVFLHPDTKDEYALARKEEKSGDKHTDFRFIFTPDVTMQEDAERRDFTCNALYYNQEDDRIIDLVGGIRDINNRIIRHVNSEHFIEDPLRVLRMCRFASKLNFDVAPETMELAGKMVASGMLNHLTKERIWKEIEAALQTRHFAKFVVTMKECGALKVILPELLKLWNTPEILKYHPEGNSGEHTILALNQAEKMSARVKFAVLLHDIGKSVTPENILPHHYGHDEVALPIIKDICRRLKVPREYAKFAEKAAKYHMKLYDVPNMRDITLVQFLEEICNHKYYAELIDFLRVCRCDCWGKLHNPSAENAERFRHSARICVQNFKIQRKIKAEDMPNFSVLKKDETFKEKFRKYRAGFVKQN